MTTIETRWTGDMAFEADVDGHKITMDADEKFGGKNKGPRPKPLVLVALSGCTGMDVVSLLNKMRVSYEAFNLKVEAETTEEHPKYYYKIHVIYEVKGKDIDRSKVEKAVNLSLERYCGVTHMLQKAAEITHEIRIIPD